MKSIDINHNALSYKIALEAVPVNLIEGSLYCIKEEME